MLFILVFILADEGGFLVYSDTRGPIHGILRDLSIYKNNFNYEPFRLKTVDKEAYFWMHV